MPFPSFGNNRGLVRPNVKAQINWAHPYAGNLAGVWTFGGVGGNTGLFGADELTGKFSPKITKGGNSTVGTFDFRSDIGAVGPCVTGPIGSNSAWDLETNLLSSGLTSGVSVVAVAMVLTNNTATNSRNIAGTNFGASNGFLFNLGKYSSSDRKVSNDSSTPLGIWVDGIKQVAAGTADNDLTLGKWTGVGMTGNPSTHQNAKVFIISPQSSPTFALFGGCSIGFTAIFNTVLPDAAMSALTLNPYDLLVFPNQFDMPILQAGPAFISGWSRQSNLPVIGGGTF
jgi:hypothetical protein